jgi:drug/metabolite transporter (DMT)-like permease
MTIIGMGAAIVGIALLSLGNAGGKFSITGLILVLLSALSYAIYMVQVKVTSLHKLPPLTLTFYAIASGIPVFLIALRGGIDLQKLPGLAGGAYALGVAVLPTVLSFLFMAIAIKYIGPTKTAIMGALEPVTALLIGITVFGETLSLRQFIGVIVILLAVSLVISAKPPRT